MQGSVVNSVISNPTTEVFTKQCPLLEKDNIKLGKPWGKSSFRSSYQQFIASNCESVEEVPNSTLISNKF